MTIIEFDAFSADAILFWPSCAHTGDGDQNGEPIPPPQPPETPEEERNRPTQPELPDPAEVGEDG